MKLLEIMALVLAVAICIVVGTIYAMSQTPLRERVKGVWPISQNIIDLRKAPQ